MGQVVGKAKSWMSEDKLINVASSIHRDVIALINLKCAGRERVKSLVSTKSWVLAHHKHHHIPLNRKLPSMTCDPSSSALLLALGKSFIRAHLFCTTNIVGGPLPEELFLLQGTHFCYIKNYYWWSLLLFYSRDLHFHFLLYYPLEKE